MRGPETGEKGVVLYLTGEFHCHFFALVSPTPNRHLPVALQHHFTVDDLGKSDIGLGCDCSTEQQEKCGFFHDGVVGG